MEFLFRNTTKISAFICLVVLLGIATTLFLGALPAIDAFGLNFIIDTKWIPNKDIFSGGSAIVGTILGTIIAMCIATPLAFGGGPLRKQNKKPLYTA